MDFVQYLHNQREKLRSINYVDATWEKLNENPSNLATKKEKQIFVEHLPFAFHDFLQSCLEKFRVLDDDADQVIGADLKYLTTLIYHSLRQYDHAENIPIRAANLFILINSSNNKNWMTAQTNPVLFNTLLQKSLEVTLCHVEQFEDVDYDYISDLNTFLAMHATKKQCVEYVVAVLHKLIESHVSEIFKQFDSYHSRNKSFLCFHCLKTLIENPSYNEADRVENMAICIKTLIKSVENRSINKSSKLVLSANIRKFLQRVLRTHLCSSWFISLFIHLSKVYFRNEDFVDLINELSKEFYDKYTDRLVKELSSDESCKLQRMAFSIVLKPPSRMEYLDLKVTFTNIVNNIIFLLGHSNWDIKETAMEIFEKILNNRNPMITDIVEGIFMCDPLRETISIITIYEILKLSADPSWKRKKFNKGFINVTCTLFINCPQYLTENIIQYLESMCLKAPSVEFKQCTSVLMKLLRERMFMYPKLIKYVLNILIHHSCCNSSSTANFYVKELYEIINEASVVNHGSNTSIEILDVLISPDYDYESLFKKMHTQNMIKDNIVKKLFETVVLNQPQSWKVVNNLLDYVNYSTFPVYTYSYFQRCTEQNFFCLNHCGDMLNSFNKIIKHKSVSNASNQDMMFMLHLESYLVESVQLHNVPIKCIALVLVLLQTLQKHTCKSLDWLTELFTELDELLHTILLDIKLAENYEREIAYIGELLILFDYRLTDRNKTGIGELLKKHNLLTSICGTWGIMLVLYGKMCMKETAYIDNCIITSEVALRNGNEYVQHNAMAVLYDLCNMHLHYFDPLFPYFIKFLFSKDDFLRYTMGKLVLQLNSEDHLKLKYNHLIAFVLLLADQNLKIRSYFQQACNEIFFKKNEQVIVKHFFQIVMHLNNYLDHHCFAFIADVEDLKFEECDVYKRKTIYKVLLKDLSKYNQLHLLELITQQFLVQILQKQMQLSPNVISILHDVAYIIECMSTEDADANFYENHIKMLNKELSKKIYHLDENSTKYEHNRIIVKVVCALMELCQRFSGNNQSLSNEIFHSTLTITKVFYSNVVASLKENGNNFRKTLQAVQKFYSMNKSYL